MLITYPSESPAEIAGLIPEWRIAADSTAASLYMTPEWVLSLWESHFGKSGIDFVFDFDHSQLRSVFPLHRRKLRKFGIPILQVDLLTNNYGQNHNELACFPVNKRSLQQFLDALDLAAWDVAYLASVPSESLTRDLLIAEATARGHSISLEPNVMSPYLSLPPDWDSFVASKSANFRSDMRRKWNKGTAAGLEVHLVSGESEAMAALDLILSIEATSWKESEGTSISSQALPLRFYQSFLPRAAKMGWLRVYLVSVKGRPIAYDMGVLLREKYYMLKTSFVEEFGKLSPGVYLRQYVIRDLIDFGGVREHDFLGDAETYKLRWTSQMRPHTNIFIYNTRSLKALALHGAKSIHRRLKSRSPILPPTVTRPTENHDF